MADYKNLQVLNLSSNFIAYDCVMLLVAKLKNLHMLKVLDLRNNYVDSDGAQELAGIVCIHTSLEASYLGGNFIRNEGAEMFARRIVEEEKSKLLSCKLKILEMSSSSVIFSGAKELAKLGKLLPQLKRLDLYDNLITTDEQEQILANSSGLAIHFQKVLPV